MEPAVSKWMSCALFCPIHTQCFQYGLNPHKFQKVCFALKPKYGLPNLHCEHNAHPGNRKGIDASDSSSIQSGLNLSKFLKTCEGQEV